MGAPLRTQIEGGCIGNVMRGKGVDKLELEKLTVHNQGATRLRRRHCVETARGVEFDTLSNHGHLLRQSHPSTLKIGDEFRNICSDVTPYSSHTRTHCALFILILLLSFNALCSKRRSLDQLQHTVQLPELSCKLAACLCRISQACEHRLSNTLNIVSPSKNKQNQCVNITKTNQ